MTAEEILDLEEELEHYRTANPDLAKYLLQIQTLKDRIKKVEWAGRSEYESGSEYEGDVDPACPWCGLVEDLPHDEDCEAFTPEGVVK